MKVDFALLADRARQDDEGKIFIEGGGVSHVTFAEDPPVRLDELAYVVRFVLDDEDRGLAHSVLVRVSAPDGTVVVQGSGFDLPAEATRRHSPHPGEEAAVVFIAVLDGLPLPQHGKYQFEFLVNGEIAVSKPVTVTKNRRRTTTIRSANDE